MEFVTKQEFEITFISVKESFRIQTSGFNKFFLAHEERFRQRELLTVNRLATLSKHYDTEILDLKRRCTELEDKEKLRRAQEDERAKKRRLLPFSSDVSEFIEKETRASVMDVFANASPLPLRKKVTMMPGEKEAKKPEEKEDEWKEDEEEEADISDSEGEEEEEVVVKPRALKKRANQILSRCLARGHVLPRRIASPANDAEAQENSDNRTLKRWKSEARKIKKGTKMPVYIQTVAVVLPHWLGRGFLDKYNVLL